jgi:hypothetical protein
MDNSLQFSHYKGNSFALINGFAITFQAFIYIHPLKVMIHCAIIGAGQIGSRHLQALCNLESPTRIDLVDPSEKSLKTALDRYEEVISPSKKNVELCCHKSMDGIPSTLDLVIIATNSNVRNEVLKEALQNRSVKNLILEKVLFQKKIDYITVDNFLKESSIPTWVSCWMRTTDLFKKIKSLLNLNECIQMKVEGSKWGMGCNSIHYMDLFSYLSGCNDFKFVRVNLEATVLNAKRKGFKEFIGHLGGRNSRDDSLDLFCKDRREGFVSIEIRNGPETYLLVTNFVNHFDLKSSNALANRIGKVFLPYQSEMTHIWVNDILKKGSCDLPTYANSMKLHLELIRVFTYHIERITGEKIDACPIT